LSRRRRPRLSVGSGTRSFGFKTGLQYPPQGRLDADIESVDTNVTIRVASLFRGTDDKYPNRFSQRLLDLTPEGIMVRPFWSSLNRRKFMIEEDIIDAHVRPRNFQTDWNVRSGGAYTSDGPLAAAGFDVITCRTTAGMVEFAVPRPDVPLMLHYITRRQSPPVNG
jgi:hypothetical protein